MPIDPFDKAICPSCGWIGSPKSVKKCKTCPHCDNYEGVTTLRRMLKDESLGDWNAVNMPVFLRALQKLGVFPQG